ncbi:MAG TPA: LuxR C-terminal-related transcriptional regulator [Streptosporangiaceae bacterium]
MADPPGETRSNGPAREQDVLLATKLYVPRTPPGFVPRPRLVGALNAAQARGVVLVCAPAGFGKTAMLADWATRRSPRPVAWLSLDAADNDPARFWHHATAALDQVRPGIAQRVGSLLGPPAPPTFEGLVTALINELASQPGPDEVLLVVDDYHVLTSRQVHESLTFLLEHLPPELRLVLASRSDPPLPLARLRALGQLAELRVSDLRFTGDEAAALLREAAGPGLPDTAAAALTARTEGWAAGLQLAGLSLRHQADVAGFVANFSGSHRFVLDYLTEEVLGRQSDEMRTFLLETSVLERLSGSLCDAVTGRSGGRAMLEAIERAGLFLVPLDEVRGWWRYHQLFADLLRVRLRQQQPARIPGLHANAAAWHEEHGLTDAAVHHAAAAGDMNWAARLIEEHFDELFYLRGERATLQRWFSALPADVLRGRPRLLLAQAAQADTGGRVEEVGGLLDDAEHAHTDAADEPYQPSAGPAASLLVNIPATIAVFRAYQAELRGDAGSTAAFASQALAEIRDGERMLDFIAQGHLAIAQWLSGRLTEAEQAFTSSIAGWRTAGRPTLIAWGAHHLGQVQRAQGRLDAAVDTYQQALEFNAPPGQPASPAAGMAYVGLGEVAYQRGDLDAARRQLTQGIALCRQFTYAPPLASGLATLAWARQADGDTSGALEAMDEAERAAPGPAAGLINPVPAQRARLLLAQGDVAGAARWTQKLGLGADDEPGYSREPEHLVLAQVLLAQGFPARALALLDRLHTAAVAQGRTGSLIEIRALQALVLAASGEEASAQSTLIDALTLAAPQGYIRVFADQAAPMGGMVGRLIAARTEGDAATSVPSGYLSGLLRAFGPVRPAPDPGRRAAAKPGLPEPPTARELEVLRLLAAGQSNQRIAHELVVTLDTVKKHVSHVLAKLGAANRTEAVSRARKIGLIP